MSDQISHQRLEIPDGLRAVAVLAVVLFHYFPDVVPGGFVGVDVFFVISGFVIAHSYLPPLISGEKTIWLFFRRRIQRLLPAYFVLLAATVAAAYAWLPPVALRNFSESLLAQAAYVQNIAFWSQGDYFDQAITKPLLHTWSLAVEEQFYLLFPIFILICRRSMRAAAVLLVLAFFVSLALGVLAYEASPKTAFYLLPARVWEFAAGIGAALVYGRLRLGRLASSVHLGCLAVILFSIFMFNEQSQFPGPHTLLAVMAAALLCATQGEGGAAIRSLLNNPVAQQMGRVSYSWYLWHWPPIVFFHAVTGERVGLLIASMGIVLTYCVALLSFEFVEKPALAWGRLRQPKMAVAVLGGFLTLTVVAGLLTADGGLNRYGPRERTLYAAVMDRVEARCPIQTRLANLDGEVCQLVPGPNPVLLMGDSHANGARPEVTRLVEESGRGLYITQQNCKPSDFGERRQCPEAVWRKLRGEIESLGIRRIVVMGYWVSTAELEYENGIRRLLETGATVYVLRTLPHGEYFDPTRRATGQASPAYTLADYQKEFDGQERALAKLKAEFGPRIQIMDPVPLLCDPVCAFDTDGKPNYADTNHLNSVGMARIRPALKVLARPTDPPSAQ